MTVEDRIVLSALGVMLGIGLALVLGPAVFSLARGWALQWSAPETTWDYVATCANPQDLQHADLCQQWRSANAAREMSLYALASLVLGTTSLVLLLMTVRLTRKATEQATEATKAAIKSASAAERAYAQDHRPWLDVEVELRAIEHFPNGGLRAEFGVVAKNIGEVPAVQVQLIGDALLSNGMMLPGPESLDEVIANRDRRMFTTIVLPGKTSSMGFQQTASVDGPTADMTKRWMAEQVNLKVPPGANVAIVYGVSYRGLAGDDVYHTVYMGWATRAAGTGPFLPGEKLSDDQLRLVEMDHYARLT